MFVFHRVDLVELLDLGVLKVKFTTPQLLRRFWIVRFRNSTLFEPLHSDYRSCPKGNSVNSPLTLRRFLKTIKIFGSYCFWPEVPGDHKSTLGEGYFRDTILILTWSLSGRKRSNFGLKFSWVREKHKFVRGNRIHDGLYFHTDKTYFYW